MGKMGEVGKRKNNKFLVLIFGNTKLTKDTKKEWSLVSLVSLTSKSFKASFIALACLRTQLHPAVCNYIES